METERKAELQARMEKDKKKWVAVVINKAIASNKDKMIGYKVATNFYSETHEIENVLHKVELDLMTNLHLGLTDAIEVKIAEVI